MSNLAQPEWHFEERVTARVMAIYRDAIGDPKPLFDEVGLRPPPRADLYDLVSGLEHPDLVRLTKVAIQRLAADQNVLAGRAPLRRCDWRVILYSLSGARTLRESISRCAECFEAIDWRCGEMKLRVNGGLALLQLDSRRPPQPSIAGCLVDLFGVIEIHGLLAWLIGRNIPIDPITLDYDPQLYSKLGLPDLPFALQLNDGWTGFGFDTAYLDYPVARNADELFARPRRNLLFLDESETRNQIASDQVREITYRSLRDFQRLPHFDQIVASVGQSQATIRRRLASEGTSYRQIKESCRRELAFDLLRRTDLSIEEVACRLDYCDSDALRQAFRTWAHCTPSEFRRQSRQEHR